MAKPSTQVVLMQALQEVKRLQHELAVQRLVTTRFCADAACIAAHNVFKRRGAIMADFMTEYLESVQEIAQLAIDDSDTKTSDGSYLEYHKATVDKAVLEAMTAEFFLPWNERHGV